MLPKATKKIKSALSRSGKSTGGAVSNIFNTLSGRRGWSSAISGYGVVAAAVGIGGASAALAAGTGGLAFPVAMLSINLTTATLNAHFARVNAQPVRKKQKKGPKL